MRGARRRRPGRSSCSRATTRSSPGPTASSLSAPAPPPPWPPPAPATCSAACSPPCWRAIWTRSRPPAPRCGCTPAPACGPARSAASTASSPATSSRRCPTPADRPPRPLHRLPPAMSRTVRDIMDADPVSVGPADSLETVLRVMRHNELPGVPVVNEGGRCVGIVTEADLVIGDEQGDLHLPHYIELFGGVVFLEPLRRFESRLRKAAALRVEDLMTPEPTTIEAGADVHRAGRIIVRSGHNRLPVIEHGRLVGVVTRVDVLEALTREA